MRFMMMIKGDAESELGAMPDEKIVAAMGRYNDALVQAGVFLAAEGLHPTSKGARLRVTRGQLSVTDGPFAEAREVIAGYWLIRVNSMAEAIAWAERCPLEPELVAAEPDKVGQIELRQLYELDDFPANEDEVGWRERETATRADLAIVPPSAAAPLPVMPDGQPKLKFMLMINADKDSEAGIMPSETLLTEMGGLMAEMARAGILLGGEGLQPSSAGARITFAGGKHTVTDGPFTETKELIAGYSTILVDSKEEAIAWATRAILIDAAGRGGESAGEIRQAFQLSDFAAVLTPELRESEERLRAQLAAQQ